MKKLLFIAVFFVSQVHAESGEESPRHAQVRREFAAHKKEIAGCYLDGVKRITEETKPEGKVVIEFILSRGGDIQKLKLVESALSNKSIENCILREVRKLKFPEGKITEKITYPFEFNAPHKETEAPMTAPTVNKDSPSTGSKTQPSDPVTKDPTAE